MDDVIVVVKTVQHLKPTTYSVKVEGLDPNNPQHVEAVERIVQQIKSPQSQPPR